MNLQRSRKKKRGEGGKKSSLKRREKRSERLLGRGRGLAPQEPRGAKELIIRAPGKKLEGSAIKENPPHSAEVIQPSKKKKRFLLMAGGKASKEGALVGNLGRGERSFVIGGG